MKQLVATLRPLLLRTLHLAGAEAIDAETLEKFDAYMADRSANPLPADLRFVTECCVQYLDRVSSFALTASLFLRYMLTCSE